jgi:hypothetical protein
MKMYSTERTTLGALIISLVSGGCDIPGRLVIRNLSDAKAVYRYETTDGNIRTIEVGNNPGQDETKIMFGLGQWWTDERIGHTYQILTKSKYCRHPIRLCLRTTIWLIFSKKEGGECLRR